MLLCFLLNKTKFWCPQLSDLFKSRHLFKRKNLFKIDLTCNQLTFLIRIVSTSYFLEMNKSWRTSSRFLKVSILIGGFLGPFYCIKNGPKSLFLRWFSAWRPVTTILSRNQQQALIKLILKIWMISFFPWFPLPNLMIPLPNLHLYRLATCKSV